MPIISLTNIELGFGADPVLHQASLQIEPGERVCLIGRNGEGKSTLMKVIEGQLQADSGEIIRQQGLKIAKLAQEVPRDTQGCIFDVVSQGLGALGELLRSYEDISHQLKTDTSEQLLKRLSDLQTQIEAADGWKFKTQVEQILTIMGLDGEKPFASLSGGMKRRVLLAQALVTQPDLLLLDEPTNHLDIEAIKWLETFLLNNPITLLFITHDRALIQKLATRIVELDRGALTSWPGSYAAYLEGKQHQLEVEASQNALFDKKLAQEEAWIRQGIKARRTRNEGRVRALKALRAERVKRRERVGAVNMRLDDSERSGKLVLDAQDLTYHIGNLCIARHFSLTVMRGDKIGLIGPNGVGKTTLIRLLLGQLEPQQGQVELGTQLQVVYFDQLRGHLDLEKSVRENVCEGSDFIEIAGQRKHVMGYLQDFLFSPARANTPVKALSGGERNRLLLAKLFTKPANLLVLDEPTNDLDVETLELLESILVDYQGTLLLVSHDRAFLNNVVTSTLGFEGGGKIQEYVGGYDEWEQQRSKIKEATEPKKEKQVQLEKTEKVDVKPAKKKLSYKDKRDLEMLPGIIEALEARQQEIHGEMAQPSFYQQDSAAIAATQEELAKLEEDITKQYQRWEEIEDQL